MVHYIKTQFNVVNALNDEFIIIGSRSGEIIFSSLQIDVPPSNNRASSDSRDHLIQRACIGCV